MAAPSPTAPPAVHPAAPRPPEGRRRPFPRLAPSRLPPPSAGGTPAPAVRGDRPSRTVSTRSRTRRGARRERRPTPAEPCSDWLSGSSVKAVLPAEGNAGDSSAEAERPASLHDCPGSSRSFASGKKLEKEVPEGLWAEFVRDPVTVNGGTGIGGESQSFSCSLAGEPQKPRQEKARLSPGRFRLC